MLTVKIFSSESKRIIATKDIDIEEIKDANGNVTYRITTLEGVTHDITEGTCYIENQSGKTIHIMRCGKP